MRNAFARQLLHLAAADERVVLLSGDIGNRLFDPFKERFPERFFNCGVAEQNMIGVAAGMALCGMRPVAYTIVPFITTRCLEQVRVDVCYHDVPVVIAGVGGGLCYANLGATHHSCEDIALLRSLPGMTVVCPGDPVETELALAAAVRHDGPVYLRLGKKGEPVVHATPPAFEIGRGIMLREGDDVALLSTGNTLPLAMEAAERLQAAGVSAGVVSLHTVKPLDDALLDSLFSQTQLVATIEEHGLIGGLGGAVAEWLCDRNEPQSARLVRFGAADRFLHESADQFHAREQYGLTVENISHTIQRHLAS